ncbi:hypothetical protein [Superficieibacter sp.]|uniref:hypothetical protein n=1 Tax=Superficieibacter sp. TaxID=2303322 RepID=UPI0028AB7EDF|nr:hypothetical protein [Superficieibacter sp.]
MPKIDRSKLTPEELKTLREKERKYKKSSRDKKAPAEIPLTEDMLAMIKKVGLVHGFPSTKISVHGRMEAISQVFEYLLKKETDSEFYQIKKTQPKRLFHLYKTVSYFKDIKGMSEGEIATLMTERQALTPRAVIYKTKERVWTEKAIANILDEKKVSDKIRELNEE